MSPLSAPKDAMENNQAALQEINALEAQAMRAAQSGREDELLKVWARILTIDPNHVRTLIAIGQQAFRKGDFQSARVAFQRAVDSDGRDPQQWIHLTLVCRSLNDEAAEAAAIEGALSADPMDLLALILRGNLLERHGRLHEAASSYSAATIVAPPPERLHPDLQSALARARSFKDAYGQRCADFMYQYLEPEFNTYAGENLKRFRDSLDIVVGRKKRYDSFSAVYHYPGLPSIEFFERKQFPWLDKLEAATDQIREEFLGVLKSEAGFTPYISYPEHAPQQQFAELNNSPRWSAFHLYKSGSVVAENVAKCPLTMSLLADAPMPDQPGRVPAAMFSLLKPQTRIPPHNGVTNCRLVTHLPIIVPEHCGFRVGNETREWVPGKAWVFDDTIEHEAWNLSDQLRVVLIFDIWHPALTPPERALVTAMTRGLDAFGTSPIKVEL